MSKYKFIGLLILLAVISSSIPNISVLLNEKLKNDKKNNYKN